jgi:hypothetical protein
MRHHHTYGRRYGRPGGWQQAQQPDASDAADWFAGRLPDTWFDGDPAVIVDREEITVIGKLPEREGSEKEESQARASGRVSRFREETRPERMKIADEAQDRYARKVSWGVEVGGERTLFTHITVPVMTRLKQPERQVLDTLVDAGIARSRSDALAWSVSTPRNGLPNYAPLCRRSTTCAQRAPSCKHRARRHKAFLCDLGGHFVGGRKATAYSVTQWSNLEKWAGRFWFGALSA